ncbi:hypothetical protein [Streptomyces sp. URMC 129]|uniref:hypothetical protein n=1 Tax=Streptomyces sp. URMC 129 TaxID=3423407 RepID=UPI003F1D3D2F
MPFDWYDREGNAIDMEQVETLLSMSSYKRIALTEVTSESDADIRFRVSTVWLGLNHNWNAGPPLIFETMVFSGEEPAPEAWADRLCQRYSNELDAKLGHEEAVIVVAATVPDEIITTQ